MDALLTSEMPDWKKYSHFFKQEEIAGVWQCDKESILHA
jgi:hypothetical protein